MMERSQILFALCFIFSLFGIIVLPCWSLLVLKGPFSLELLENQRYRAASACLIAAVLYLLLCLFSFYKGKLLHLCQTMFSNNDYTPLMQLSYQEGCRQVEMKPLLCPDHILTMNEDPFIHHNKRDLWIDDAFYDGENF